MNRQLRPSPERQQYRDARGRYTEMYRCELCGRPAGPNYRSDRRCNVYGIGVVLCPPCAALSETIPDDQYQAVYQKAAQYHSMFGRPLKAHLVEVIRCNRRVRERLRSWLQERLAVQAGLEVR